MRWIGIGSWMLAASIAAGAFGAHGLESRLEAMALEQWETASKYLAYAALAVIVMGLAGSQARSQGETGPESGRVSSWPAGPARAMVLGALVFSGTVFGLALGGPRILGAVTPLGGISMIGALVVFGLGAIRREP